MLSHLCANANHKIIVKPLFYLITTDLTAPTITVTPLSATSFNVNWTMTNNNSQNYTVTWTNLGTEMMDDETVAGNMTSYTVTELSGMDNYIVIVTANYLNGSAPSNPNTVYGT